MEPRHLGCYKVKFYNHGGAVLPRRPIIPVGDEFPTNEFHAPDGNTTLA
jgi:hypothetical protein